eukprot:scaffold1492_cov257-Pinguiococcus_pyrenoidosus.AAC.4
MCNFIEWRDQKIVYKRYDRKACLGDWTLRPGQNQTWMASWKSELLTWTRPALHDLLRYASLYFVACVDKSDNELLTLEQIHLFVEVLDR